MVHARQDDCAVVFSLIIQRNAPLDHVGTTTTLQQRGNIDINVAKSCGVSSDREFCIVRVGDESPPAVRSESAIETVILRVLSY